MTTSHLVRRRLVRATIALLVAVLALSGCSVYDIPLPGGAKVGRDPMKVHVQFRDVLDLVPQTTVKVDDVTVGTVADISLDGYIADVTINLPRKTDLPANMGAQIRQTSLLGEKFVSLVRPENPIGRLADGDVIKLEATGRNPEVEEVLGALALLLNGGGVAQFRTIAEEFNSAFGGRESEVRSIIEQLGSFMGQLDSSKGSIVTALENVNKLSLEMRRQDGAIKAALDELPAAVASLDGQRSDLVTMLQAVEKLSGVGVRVIKASKESTIDSLTDLAPALKALADSGDNLPKSLQAAITYPFIDAAVGSDPQVARNLHMGDFTNLSMRLNLDFVNLPSIPGLGAGLSLADVVSGCEKTPLGSICKAFQDALSGKQLEQLCGLIPVLCPKSAKSAAAKSAASQKPTKAGGVLGGLLGGTAQQGQDKTGPTTEKRDGFLSGLFGGIFGGRDRGRAATGFDTDAPQTDLFLLEGTGYDPALGTLLLQGVAFE